MFQQIYSINDCVITLEMKVGSATLKACLQAVQ